MRKNIFTLNWLKKIKKMTPYWVLISLTGILIAIATS